MTALTVTPATLDALAELHELAVDVAARPLEISAELDEVVPLRPRWRLFVATVVVLVALPAGVSSLGAHVAARPTVTATSTQMTLSIRRQLSRNATSHSSTFAVAVP